MRSELVFGVLANESNRYQLVKLVAKGTRSLHRPNTRVPDTINGMLERLSKPASARKPTSFERETALELLVA